MTDTTVEEQAGQRKSSKLSWLLGIVLAIVGAGGGYYMTADDPFAVLDKIVKIPGSGAARDNGAPSLRLGDVAFVEVPVLVIPLGAASSARHLRFRATLEVPAASEKAVSQVVPRVQDVFNRYLRALEPEDFDATGALIRVRSQLLRRIRMVVGEEHVRDILVLEFIVN